MTMALLKRQFLLWGFTFAGAGLLLIAGLLLSFWIGNNPSLDVGETMDGMQLGWWRAVIYSALLLFWPRLVSRVIHNREQSQPHLLSRRPLIILIILYECLIVQNPLSVILAWVG
jgi:hypothetical protein